MEMTYSKEFLHGDDLLQAPSLANHAFSLFFLCFYLYRILCLDMFWPNSPQMLNTPVVTLSTDDERGQSLFIALMTNTASHYLLHWWWTQPVIAYCADDEHGYYILQNALFYLFHWWWTRPFITFRADDEHGQSLLITLMLNMASHCLLYWCIFCIDNENGQTLHIALAIYMASHYLLHW